MNDRNRARETEKVVRRVMKAMEKYDQIGKAEFEEILHHVIQQVHKNTGIDMARIAEATPTVLNDLPNEYGQFSGEHRSWEAMIGYIYAKHLKVLGVLE